MQAGTRGVEQAWKTIKKLWKRREPRRFLIAYLFYQDGVNTVIVFSSIFAATTLHFGTGELVGLYITVQVTALVGAFTLAKPTDTWGPKKVVMLSLVLWTLGRHSLFCTYQTAVLGRGMLRRIGARERAGWYARLFRPVRAKRQ